MPCRIAHLVHAGEDTPADGQMTVGWRAGRGRSITIDRAHDAPHHAAAVHDFAAYGRESAPLTGN